MISTLILKLLDYIQIIISKFHTILFKKIKIILITNNIIPRSDELYRFSKNICEYHIKNEREVNNFIEKLNHNSKEIVKLVLNRIHYIYTHNLLDMKKLLNTNEMIKIKEINKFMITCKKKIKLPIYSYEVSVFYYLCGLKFLPQEVINNLINKDFIDGGAYIGDSALIFEKYFHPKKIYAFEPELENYNLMLNTIKLNNLKNVIPIRKGLGEKEERLKIISKGSCSYISYRGEKSINITTIDNLVFKNNLSIGLIKLDIEGFELNALKGAEKTIKEFKPVLLISIYHNGKEFFETINFIQKINSNYRCIIRKINPSNPFFETILIAWNIDF